MKREELEKLGLEKEQIDSIMKVNGSDIENAKREVNQLREDLANRDSTISELNEKITGLTVDSEEVDSLKKQIEDYKTAEEERIATEKKMMAEQVLNDQIERLIGERQFVSEYAKAGFISEIKAKREADKVSGLKDIFEEMTKDQDGIFKNPQHEKIELPGTGKKEDLGKGEWKGFF